MVFSHSLGQNRKCLRRPGSSVLPPTADTSTPIAQARFVPEAEFSTDSPGIHQFPNALKIDSLGAGYS
jgi:hypothetical protein